MSFKDFYHKPEFTPSFPNSLESRIEFLEREVKRLQNEIDSLQRRVYGNRPPVEWQTPINKPNVAFPEKPYPGFHQ